ncbi:hypothetical protein ACHQM5_028353 [Ranunculus cassubicifolius]
MAALCTFPKPTTISLQTNFIPPNSQSFYKQSNPNSTKTPKSLSISINCTAPSPRSTKIVKYPNLDKHIIKQNKIRFVQKLKTLLLSKPKHYIPLTIISKCRSYLSLPRPRSVLSMVHRYPTIFRVFTIPSASIQSSYAEQVCIGLTPEASSLFAQELSLKSSIAGKLAVKLQKLLMLSSHKRLLLNKLVHLASDLGLPPNFRSRLCNDHPNLFKTVDTSYGRALELVSWDPKLAIPLPSLVGRSPPGLIVDRPLKFKYLRLRKGLNLKRKHREFLIKFGEMPDVNPYCEEIGELPFLPETIEAEKRACGVVREVLGMMVEKRTLVDHLTHFRKDFSLSNKVRGMLVRHPELFYVSLKGTRDSVFLNEGYDDKGKLLEKDDLLLAKERLMEFVREGKKMRRAIRLNGGIIDNDEDVDDYEYDEDSEDEDGFEGLFAEDEWEDYGIEDDPLLLSEEFDEKFWTVEDNASVSIEGKSVSLKHW